MNIYQITFEVRYPSINVQNEVIVNGIRSLGPWARVNNNIYLIKSYYSKEYVLNYMRSYLGPNDMLMVQPFDRYTWRSVNLPQEVVNWIKFG
jgi:hypothetical protein